MARRSTRCYRQLFERHLPTSRDQPDQGRDRPSRHRLRVLRGQAPHRHRLTRETKYPIVALHPVPFRVLELNFAQQLETELAADAVRRAVVDGWESVDGATPVRRPCHVDCLRQRRRCDAAALELGPDAPTDLVDVFTVPLAVPEVDPADRHSIRQDRLVDVCSIRPGGGDVALVPQLELFWRLRSAEVLRHLGRVQPYEQLEVIDGPWHQLNLVSRGMLPCHRGWPRRSFLIALRTPRL